MEVEEIETEERGNRLRRQVLKTEVETGVCQNEIGKKRLREKVGFWGKTEFLKLKLIPQDTGEL